MLLFDYLDSNIEAVALSECFRFLACSSKM